MALEARPGYGDPCFRIGSTRPGHQAPAGPEAVSKTRRPGPRGASEVFELEGPEKLECHLHGETEAGGREASPLHPR